MKKKIRSLTFMEQKRRTRVDDKTRMTLNHVTSGLSRKSKNWGLLSDFIAERKQKQPGDCPKK
jgi:hypothetical protein